MAAVYLGELVGLLAGYLLNVLGPGVTGVKPRLWVEDILVSPENPLCGRVLALAKFNSRCSFHLTKQGTPTNPVSLCQPKTALDGPRERLAETSGLRTIRSTKLPPLGPG